jgi:hypothetical protein
VPKQCRNLALVDAQGGGALERTTRIGLSRQGTEGWVF